MSVVHRLTTDTILASGYGVAVSWSRRRRRVLLLAVPTVLLVAAVGVQVRLPPAATDLEDPPRGDLSVKDAGRWRVGDFRVELQHDAERLVVTHPAASAPVWETRPGEAFLTAAVGEASWRDDYGLLRVADTHAATWHDQRIESVTRHGSALRIQGSLTSDAASQDLPWQVTLRAAAPRRLSVDARLDGRTSQPPNRLYLAARLGRAESVHGFGAQTGPFNLRGRRIALLPREQGIGRRSQPLSTLVDLATAAAGDRGTTYLTSAVHVTSRSRSLAYRGDRIASVDLRAPERMVWEVWDNRARFVAVAADDPLAALSAHRGWTGRADPSPEWTRDGVIAGLQGGTEVVRRKVRSLQSAGVPLTAVWLQDWSGQRTTDFGERLQWNWDLDKQRYPGWKDLVADLREQGIRTLTYVNPSLSPDSGRAAERAGGRNLYAEAADRGYLVCRPDGSPYLTDQRGFDAALVDLSNPKAREWLTDVLVDEVAAAGVSGWMADFGAGPPPDAVLHGGRGAQWRARWSVLWQRVNRTAMRRAGLSDDGLVWHRSGHSASAGAADALWLGDQTQDWSSEDGIASVPALLHSTAASGMSQVHGDVGGYTSLDLPLLADVARDPELMARWAEVSVLGPVLRTHEGNRPDAAAQPTRNPRLAARLAASARLFAALAPEKERLQRAGPPTAAQHHPWMLAPEHEELVGAADDELSLGRNVLLAPVLSAGRTTVEVTLPPGRWAHVWTGAEYGADDDVTHVTVDAPVGRPALFVRTGTPVADELLAFAEREVARGD